METKTNINTHTNINTSVTPTIYGNTNTNTITNPSVTPTTHTTSITTPLITQLDNLLTLRGWKRCKTPKTDIYFYNNERYSLYDEVRFCLTNDIIKISVPVKDFPFLYVSKFNQTEIDNVITFVEKHLDAYERVVH
jgi:hypothetical protein